MCLKIFQNHYYIVKNKKLIVYYKYIKNSVRACFEKSINLKIKNDAKSIKTLITQKL